MSKIRPCFFFDPIKNLYTGEDTPLDLLLSGIPLSTDIQIHINEFLGEEPQVPTASMNNSDAYLICHDKINNEYVIPIDEDEKHCFEQEFEDDFVVLW
tara:strand:- start:879 stop:1172 length:294 start_codon:yes stop_codon:yes gene_type:complete